MLPLHIFRKHVYFNQKNTKKIAGDELMKAGNFRWQISFFERFWAVCWIKQEVYYVFVKTRSDIANILQIKHSNVIKKKTLSTRNFLRSKNIIFVSKLFSRDFYALSITIKLCKHITTTLIKIPTLSFTRTQIFTWDLNNKNKIAKQLSLIYTLNKIFSTFSPPVDSSWSDGWKNGIRQIMTRSKASTSCTKEESPWRFHSVCT